MKNEPAIKAMIIAAVALLVAKGVIHGEHADEWTVIVESIFTVIVLPVVGYWIRSKVMPVETIKDAGLSPDVVKARAADETVTRYEE